MFHVKHAPPAPDDGHPLCLDRGTCYLPAGHYPFSFHQDRDGRWMNIPAVRAYNQRRNYR